MPQQTAASRKARFIATEAAQSALELAEGGQLPDLQFQDSGESKEKQADGSRQSSMNPLVLMGAISLSLVLSVALLLVDTDTQPVSDQTARKLVMQQIERDYFRELEAEVPLKQYQKHLREAKRAHTRNDFRTERKLYMTVLNMLREERRAEDDRWLTGTRDRDETLEKYLTTLLSD